MGIDKDYRDKIASSTIIFKIRRTAIALFNGWTRNAKYYGEMNEETAGNIDEDLIVNDFTECLNDAINGISDEDRDKKDEPGWAFGFICGFIEGSLHVRWYARYVIQKSDEYRKSLFFHSAYRFFEANPNLLIKVWMIYSYYMEAESDSVTNPGHSMGETDVSENTEFNRLFMEYMEKESLKMLFGLHQRKSPINYCPRVGDYLTQGEVEKVLKECGLL